MDIQTCETGVSRSSKLPPEDSFLCILMILWAIKLSYINCILNLLFE